jgi:colicin import membrane protein
MSQTDLIIRSSFEEIDAKLTEAEAFARAIVVQDEQDKPAMKKARETRLALRTLRTTADKVRKDLKADALEYGRKVQDVYNSIEARIKPLEAYLQEQEDYAKIREEARIAELHAARAAEIEPFAAYAPNLAWGRISDADFQQALAGAKALQAAAVAEAERQEQERLAREEAARLEAIEEAKRREALRIENERLQREAAEARRAAEAEASIRAKEEAHRIAEARAARDAEERARKEAQAPDAEKLQRLADALRAYSLPDVSTAFAAQTIAETRTLLAKIAAHIESRIAQQ